MRLFRTRFVFVVLLASLLASVVDPAWAATVQTLFTTQTPAVTNATQDNKNYEKGLAFYAVAAGQITAVRFWKASLESGTHVGKIWSSGGTLLGSVTFVNETASGWQQQSLASPLSISANTTYIVSVNTTKGYYVYTDDGLGSQVANGNLRSVVGNNGRSGPIGLFPSNTVGDQPNFFRDVVFVPAPVSSLGSVALSPSIVNGGSSSTGTVTLTSPAPSGGAVVTLSSNNGAAIVPASVTVGAGSTTGTFTVNTSAVGATTSASISGSYNGSKSATLTINPPAISTISLNPTSVTGGSSSTGTVTLTSPAPAGGAAVTLSTNNAVVPASVTVGAGLTTGTFTVNTSAVGATTSASISGSYNGSKSATLTINSPVLSTISLNPNSVTGGTVSTGTAILTGPAAAGGAVVALSGINPIVAGIQGVHSPTGLPQDGSIDWSTTGPLYGLLPSTPVLIAGMPGSAVTVATATGLAPEILSNCSSGGDCGWYGDFTPGASVLWMGGTYNGSTGGWAPNGPLTISFSSPQRGLGLHIMSDEWGPFTATLCAYNPTNALLGCIPFSGNATDTADGSAIFIGLYDDIAEISRVTVDAGGALYPHDFAIGQVYVANTRRQMVPASVMVPPGATGVTFPVSTSAVSTNTVVTITGSYILTQAASLSINPPLLSAISLDPASVAGGASSTGTATLSGPAPVGGAAVTLSGVNPIFAGIQGVHSSAGLPQDGSIDWSNLGPLPSSVSSGVAVPIAGLAGSTMTISTATGLPARTLSNCSSGGSCGWYGNFASGASVLWMGGTYNGSTGEWAPNGPLTISFNSPQRGLGFQIMADELGPFTATVCAYSSTNALLGCVPFSGNSSVAADGSAVFIGLYDDAAEISRVTVDAGGTLYPHDFAVGQVYVDGTRRPLVPASVTVPPGDTSATFAVTANSVNTSTSVNISGSYSGSRTATLDIHP